MLNKASFTMCQFALKFANLEKSIIHDRVQLSAKTGNTLSIKHVTTIPTCLLLFWRVLKFVLNKASLNIWILPMLPGADPGFPIGGAPTLGRGCQPPTQALFGENICKNERIWSCWGGGGRMPETFVCRSATGSR